MALHLKLLGGGAASAEHAAALAEDVRALNAVPPAGVLSIFHIARRAALRDEVRLS